MPASRTYSITKKLTRMNMLVSGAALLIACIAFFAYDWITFRDAMVRSRSIEAQIIAANTVSALMFNDPSSAERTLSALRASPRVLFAGVYAGDGRPFASYWRGSRDFDVQAPEVPSGRSEIHFFRKGQFALASPVLFQGKQIGTVYIRSDLRDIEERLVKYGEIVAAVLLVSLLAALLLSGMSQQKISKPIVDLAGVAGTVSRERNYSVRAKATGEDDELSLLITSFNEMLAQIQQRDSALQYAHDELEARVLERTGELERAQQDLRSLSGQLIQMQDDERRRIARELHDSAGQLLVALKLNLAQIQRKVEQLGPEAAPMAESLDLIDQLTQELRTISHLLHPPLLDELGLGSATRWYVEGFAKRSGIGVDLQLDSDFGRLSRELETTIFRIVQECLTNIHRHSGSDTARVRIKRDAEKVEVEIQDRGNGMPSDVAGGFAGPVVPGVGIRGMRERVRQLGGVLEFRSGPEGTTVLATLPVATGQNGDSLHRRIEGFSKGTPERVEEQPPAQ